MVTRFILSVLVVCFCVTGVFLCRQGAATPFEPALKTQKLHNIYNSLFFITQLLTPFRLQEYYLFLYNKLKTLYKSSVILKFMTNKFLYNPLQLLLTVL